MPGFDLQIGSDGDYIDDGQGGFVLTETAQPSIRHQLLDRLGEWVGDPNAGRDRRGLQGRNASGAELALEIESMRRALRPLEKEGIIADVNIAAERQGTRFVMAVHCRDTQTGLPVSLSSEEFSI